MPIDTSPVTLESLEATKAAQELTYALLCLMVYEHLITLNDEMEYFWTRRWTISRILFFANRYLSPLIVILAVLVVTCHLIWFCPGAALLNVNFFFSCGRIIQATFLLDILVVGIIQGMLVTRIWYLYQNSRVIQFAVILCFIASLFLSLAFLYLSAHDMLILVSHHEMNGCLAGRPTYFWTIYLPSFILHTILYILTAYRALRNKRVFEQSPILKCLLRDGGLFYLVVFFTVAFTAIGSFLTHTPQLNNMAIFTPFLLALTSIAVSRVMFSIQSLASRLGSDQAWLLNNVELRRVRYRQGAHEGELIVEHDTVDKNDGDEENPLPNYNWTKAPARSTLRLSRVGILPPH